MATATATEQATPEMIHQALSKTAEYHLKTVREEGEMIICQTKRGNVFLSYSNGVYELCTQGLMSVVLAGGKKAEVKDVLMSLYVVEGV